mgnify:CR=1 FL=1
MLEGEGLVRRWEGRFGILGEKGGFLSADVVGNTAMQAMMSNANSLQPGNNGATTNSNEAMPFATDAGDLCNFVGGMASGGPLFVGHPTMASLCPGICARASIDVLVGRVLAAHRDVKELVEIGAYVAGTDPEADAATRLRQDERRDVDISDLMPLLHGEKEKE